MLRLENINYITPPPRRRTILESADLEIQEKEHSVIYGANGSGKTTIIQLLLKLIDPTGGTVRGGTDAAVGVFEDADSQLFFSTVYEEICSVRVNEEEKMKKAAAALGLENMIERSTLELSYSEKIRLIFAVAYMTGRQFMLIDCPPTDEKIDALVAGIIEKEERTMVYFLPEGGARRDLSKNWIKYRLNEGRIIKE